MKVRIDKPEQFKKPGFLIPDPAVAHQSGAVREHRPRDVSSHIQQTGSLMSGGSRRNVGFRRLIDDHISPVF
jgi:hypothetical protein